MPETISPCLSMADLASVAGKPPPNPIVPKSTLAAAEHSQLIPLDTPVAVPTSTSLENPLPSIDFRLLPSLTASKSPLNVSRGTTSTIAHRQETEVSTATNAFQNSGISRPSRPVADLQPDAAYLTAKFGMKIRDFAYESTLAPIHPFRFIQVQPGLSDFPAPKNKGERVTVESVQAGPSGREPSRTGPSRRDIFRRQGGNHSYSQPSESSSSQEPTFVPSKFYSQPQEPEIPTPMVTPNGSLSWDHLNGNDDTTRQHREPSPPIRSLMLENLRSKLQQGNTFHQPEQEDEPDTLPLSFHPREASPPPDALASIPTSPSPQEKCQKGTNALAPKSKPRRASAAVEVARPCADVTGALSLSPTVVAAVRPTPAVVGTSQERTSPRYSMRRRSVSKTTAAPSPGLQRHKRSSIKASCPPQPTRIQPARKAKTTNKSHEPAKNRAPTKRSNVKGKGKAEASNANAANPPPKSRSAAKGKRKADDDSDHMNQPLPKKARRGTIKSSN